MSISDSTGDYFNARLDFEDLSDKSYKELTQLLLDVESQVNFAGSLNGDVDPVLVNLIRQDAQCIRAELARRREKPETAKSQSEIWPEMVSAEQLLSLPADPTRWIWNLTLPVGGASVLVAKPKCGKSSLAVNLTIAVSRGVPFLGRDTQQCTVAYLSLDASLPEIAELFAQFNLRSTDPVFIHAGAAPPDSIGWLVHVITSKGARFVVIDTLQRLFRFQDVNDYSQVTNTIEPVIEAARQHSAHVMFSHHAKKDAGDDLDSAIGSTAIRGIAYTYLHIKRLPESDRRILRSDQRGGKNINELAIGFGADGWLDSQGSRQDAEIEDTRPKIKELLEGAEDGGMHERDIRREIQARGIVVSKALRAMLKDGEVERTGKGKRGEAFRYHLAGLLLEASDKPSGLSPDSSSSLLLSSSSSLKGNENSGIAGIESKKNGQVIENTDPMLFPKKRELNGKSREENGKESVTGIESAALSIFDGGRVVKRATGA